MLLKHKERINTECRIAEPVLNVRAIKIDANKNSLKQEVGCKSLKSCDYFKKKKQKLYFIEVSDFDAQLKDLSKKSTSSEAKKYIKMEIRLKLSDTLLIFNEMCKTFTIHRDNIHQNKMLLTLCTDKKSDVIAWAQLSRELIKHYCPTHFSSIQIIPYTEIDNIFQRR